MDLYVRDVNGNTLYHVEDVLDGWELYGITSHVTDAGNIMVTVDVSFSPRDPDAEIAEYEDEEREHAERMTADDMRAAPDWSL